MTVEDIFEVDSGASLTYNFLTNLVIFFPIVGWLMTKRVFVFVEAKDYETGICTSITAKARMPYWRCNNVKVTFSMPKTVPTNVFVKISDRKEKCLYARNLSDSPDAILGVKCRDGKYLTAGVEYTVNLDERDSTNPRNR